MDGTLHLCHIYVEGIYFSTRSVHSHPPKIYPCYLSHENSNISRKLKKNVLFFTQSEPNTVKRTHIGFLFFL